MEPGRRVVIEEHGEDPLDAIARHLRIEEQPFPDTAQLGSGDVVVAVRSAAVGWVDLIMASGQYQHMVPPPYTPGLEYAGEVAWVGGEVTGLTIGDAVVADGLQTGPRSLGDYQRWGGFASYAVAPASAAIPVPGGLGFGQASHLLGAYETAYHALVHRGALQAGETVLIHGASGTTGLAAVHLAKLIGATVIATGRSPDKLAVVREQGADHVVCTGEAQGGVGVLRDEVKALTGDQGVDVVWDGVGGEISAASLRCVRFGARFVLVGWAATPFVARGKGRRGAPNVNVLPTNLIMMKGVDVLGCPAAISAHRDPGMRRRRLAQVLEWAEQGRIVPYVSETFPLEDVTEAMRAKWRGACVGGCALHPGA